MEDYTNNHHLPRNGLDIRSVVVLFHNGRLLLLRRASWKKFAPNRWTGLGGKVEPTEIGDLTASALRELFEETDLCPDEVRDVYLRRLLLFHEPSEGLVCLAYVTGTTKTGRVPACNEGALQWVAPDELANFDVIANTAAVLPLLINDRHSAPVSPRCGIALYSASGQLERIDFPE